MTKKERIKKVNEQVKLLIKKGFGTAIALGGKLVEQIAHNKSTLALFEKRVKRQKERKKVLKEVDNYNKKRTEKINANENKKIEEKRIELKTKAKQDFDSAKLTKKTGRIIKQEFFRDSFPHFQNWDKAKSLEELNVMEKKLDNSPSPDKIVENIIDNHGFLKSYFTELIQDNKYTSRIDTLSSAFGNNLDKYFDFINDVTKEDFKEYTDGNMNLKSDDAESYHDMMVQRLEKMEQLATSKFKLKLPNY